MAINTTISSLSQTAALNGPDGSTDLPSALDDSIRYHGQFIAQLRDGVGYGVGAIVAGLGFTPPQQGTGPSQTADIVKIGWSAGSQLRLAINATDYGATWPISISGNAATATTATNATNATNSTNATNASNAATVGGVAAASLLRNTSGTNTVGMRWSGSALIPYVNGNEFGGVWPILTDWSLVQGRPTGLSQLTNDIQTVSSSTFNGVNTCSATMFSGGGAAWSAVPVSDRAVKKNIEPTLEDSLQKIARLRFKAFDFDLDKLPDQTAERQKLGVVAQEAQEVDANFVQTVPTDEFLHLNEQHLLMTALHAIQQLQARVAALEAQ